MYLKIKSHFQYSYSLEGNILPFLGLPRFAFHGELSDFQMTNFTQGYESWIYTDKTSPDSQSERNIYKLRYEELYSEK